MTIRFVASTFQPHIDTVFRVATDAGELPLHLAEVSDVRRGRFESFTLLFHGPPDRILPPAQHSLQHDVLGELRIFMGPVVGSDAERTLYEAVFNVAPEMPPAR